MTCIFCQVVAGEQPASVVTLHVTKIFGQAAPRAELERQARSLRDCMVADPDTAAVTDRN